MCKNIFLISLISITFCFGDSFEKNCKSCHGENQLKMFMAKYTLEYSSAKKIQSSMETYLKNPSYEKSIMPTGFLNRFGIKEKTTLNDTELKKMLSIYYENYNLSLKFY